MAAMRLQFFVAPEKDETEAAYKLHFSVETPRGRFDDDE